MKRLALFVLFLAPFAASAQPEKAAEARLAPSALGTGAASAAPVPLTLNVPNLAAAPVAVPLSGAPNALPALAAAPALTAAPAPSPAASVSAPRTTMSPAPIPAMRAAPTAAPSADGQEAGSDGGRLFFDGGAARGDAAPAVSAAASDGPRLSRPVERAEKPAPAIPFGQRAGEAADLGVMALGFQFLTGLAFLALGAHAGFPALAGAFWVLAGTELIKQLGRLRSTVVGGWQASHDQKMRTDYGTGRLRDIRGRKYGEDRYDEWAPGAVSSRERWTLDAAAFALGLPWVLPAGPKAVALYAAGAAAAIGLRRLLRASRRADAPAGKNENFEYDR